MSRAARSSASRVRDTETFEAVAHIAEHGAPRQQGRILEHDGAVRTGPRHHLAVDQDAAAGRRDQAIDHGEESGLAATRRANNGDELAIHHLQIDAVERHELRIGARLRIGKPDVLGFEFWRHAATCGRQTSTRRSMRRMSSTSATPAAAMVSTPTNTLSVSKREPA